MVIRLMICVMLLCARGGSAAVILQYHHVSDHTPASTSVSPEQFAAHLRAIKAEGFRVIRLDQLIKEVRAGLDPRERVLAITFDDGFADIADNALPLLRQYNWPSAIFVTTDQIGGADMLDADGLISVHRQGHLLLNHAARHDHLVRRQEHESRAQWLGRVKANINNAQQTLTALLGEAPPRYFAWPYGEHDDALRAQLQEMGFIAFGQQTGALHAEMDWQQVPRIAVNKHYADWPALRDKLLSLPMPVSDIAPASGITFESMPQLRFSLPASWHERPLNCFAAGASTVPVAELRDERLYITLSAPVPQGRSRFTCTSPAASGRYYWFSWLWMRRAAQGWYQE